MEPRQLIAYALLALILASLVAAYFHLTREVRAHRRSYRKAAIRTRERIEASSRS